MARLTTDVTATGRVADIGVVAFGFPLYAPSQANGHTRNGGDLGCLNGMGEELGDPEPHGPGMPGEGGRIAGAQASLWERAMSERGHRSEPEKEGALWCLDLLTAAERAQLRRAFRRSPELREALEEAVLSKLPPAIREQFVVAFANRLADAPRPPMAVLPALMDAAVAVRPRRWRASGRGGRGSGER